MLLTSIILEIIVIANIYVIFDICTFYENYAKYSSGKAISEIIVKIVSFIKIRSFVGLTDDILYLKAS